MNHKDSSVISLTPLSATIIYVSFFCDKLFYISNMQIIMINIIEFLNHMIPKEACDHSLTSSLFRIKLPLLIHQLLLSQAQNLPNDLCCIFFNLLDNGINACKASENDAPFLNLNCRTKADFIIIDMENSKNPKNNSGKVRKNAKHSDTSHKGMPEHGFGLLIIKETAEKYDGSCQWQDLEGTFHSTVMLRYQ